MKHEFYQKEIEGSTLKISMQAFDNTSELAKYIKTTLTNSIWKNEDLDSMKKRESSFNDFDSLEDAIQALEYGTDKYYDKFKKNIKKVQDFISKKEKNKTASYKNDRVGFLPIVPKVLQGNPINMISQDVKPKPYPTAKILIEKSNSGGVDSKNMCEFYSIIFVLIQLLENKGIRCEIWAVESGIHDDEIMVHNLKLKNYTQPLNAYKIQFPIIASDYLRRIIFRLMETNPDIQTDWTFGYGRPLHIDYDEETCKKIEGAEENDIYIPSCQTFKYRAGKDLDKTIQEIINGTNLRNYIKLTE